MFYPRLCYTMLCIAYMRIALYNCVIRVKWFCLTGYLSLCYTVFQEDKYSEGRKTTKENKQVNFRIDPDSAEAFRQFCTSHGMNQAQGFDHLLQVLELNNAKAEVPGRIVEIENFERLLKDLLSAYIGSIELSSNAELRVQEHFQSDLKRKDRTIDELREKAELMEAEKKEHAASMTALCEEQKRLQEQAQYAIKQMEAAKKAASDQEEMNRILQMQNQELQNKMIQYDALLRSEEEARNEAASFRLKTQELEQKLSHEMDQKRIWSRMLYRQRRNSVNWKIKI